MKAPCCPRALWVPNIFRSRTPREALTCSLPPPADPGAAGPSRPQNSTPLRRQRLSPRPRRPSCARSRRGGGQSRQGWGRPSKSSSMPFPVATDPKQSQQPQANPGPRLRRPGPRQRQDADPVPLTAGASILPRGGESTLVMARRPTGHGRGVAALSSPLSTGTPAAPGSAPAPVPTAPRGQDAHRRSGSGSSECGACSQPSSRPRAGVPVDMPGGQDWPSEVPMPQPSWRGLTGQGLLRVSSWGPDPWTAQGRARARVPGCPSGILCLGSLCVPGRACGPGPALGEGRLGPPS